ARHGDARCGREQIGNSELLAGANLLGLDQRDRVADAGQRLLDAVCRDHDALELIRAGDVSSERARGREQAGKDEWKRRRRRKRHDAKAPEKLLTLCTRRSRSFWATSLKDRSPLGNSR